jgi:D-glycero-D-manno-heptose 1,7-bisphosphate phosphatase
LETHLATPSPALFLDRDGVIKQEIGYLHKKEDIVWVEGIFDLCRLAVDLGYKLVVVTNQAGIGRGLYSQAQFDTLTDWMKQQFHAQGAPLSEVYCCPYHPEHGLGDYRRDHEDRKPGPGMLLRAARDHDLDLAQSVLVGDRYTDIAAAQAAGLRQAFLLHGTEMDGPCPFPHLPVASLIQVSDWLRVKTPTPGLHTMIQSGDLA